MTTNTNTWAGQLVMIASDDGQERLIEAKKTRSGREYRRLKLAAQDGSERWFSAWPREAQVMGSRPEAEWVVTFETTTLQSGRDSYWITRALAAASGPPEAAASTQRVTMPAPQAAQAAAPKQSATCQHGLGLTARCSGCIKLEVAFKAAVDVLTNSTDADGGVRVGLSDVYTVTSRFEQILHGAEFVEGVGLQDPGQQKAQSSDDDFLEVEV
jgi:hypothetical protein